MSQLASTPLRAAACQRTTAAVAPRQGFAAAPALRQQQPVQKRRQLCRAAAEPEAAPAGNGMPVVKPSLMSPAWQEVVDLKKEGTTVETTIKAANKSGVQVQVGKLTGFLPYKLLDPIRLPQRKPGGGLPPVPARGYQELIGQPVKVKVTQVIVPEKRLIVSEKAVLLEDLARLVAVGDVIEGVVTNVTDFGAFVECLTLRGQPSPRAEAVLPLREISYAWVANASEVLSPGQPVRVVVTWHQTEPTSKVVVSLKRLEDDPLQETLDKVLPLNEDADMQLDAVPAAVPAGIEEILEALAGQPGVESVTLGRTVQEKRTVSQDLELWITKEEVEYGFNLAVRAGRVVQEVRVATGMSADEMRAAVQRVLRSIN